MIAGTAIDGDAGDSMHPKQSEGTYVVRTKSPPSSSNRGEIFNSPPYPTNSWIKIRGKDQWLSNASNAQEVINSKNIVKHSVPLNLIPPIGHENAQSIISLLDPRVNTSKDTRFGEGGQLFPSNSSGFTFDVDDLNIPWSDLEIKDRIGAGIIFWLLLNIG